MKNDFSLSTPEETAQHIAGKTRALRLSRNWKQVTLAERSGVTLASLRRFEHTGQASLKNLLKLAFALGRLDDFETLLKPPVAALQFWTEFQSLCALKTISKNRQHVLKHLVMSIVL